MANQDPEMRADEQVVATPGRWLILLAMTGSLAMIMLDTTVVAVALPSIQKSLGVDQNMLEWVIVAYLVILASFMALGGRFGDVIGKPRAFVIGIIGFGVSSLLSGLAWNGEALIGFRIMQGFFAVIMQPSSSAIVINSFAPGNLQVVSGMQNTKAPAAAGPSDRMRA